MHDAVAFLAQLDWVELLVLVVTVPTFFALALLLVGILTWSLVQCVRRVVQARKAGRRPRGTRRE